MESWKKEIIKKYYTIRILSRPNDLLIFIHICLLTLYLVLSCTGLPSLSQLTEGLGLPNAVQLRVMLPPSLASTYCGGVSVNVGGAETQTKKISSPLAHWNKSGRFVYSNIMPCDLCVFYSPG